MAGVGKAAGTGLKRGGPGVIMTKNRLKIVYMAAGQYVIIALIFVK